MKKFIIKVKEVQEVEYIVDYNGDSDDKNEIWANGTVVDTIGIEEATVQEVLSSKEI